MRGRIINVGGIKVDIIDTAEVIERMKKWIRNLDYGNYIVIANANDVIKGRKDKKVKEAVNRSSLSVADGISIIFWSRLYNFSLRKRVYGPELMKIFLELSQKEGFTHFFYGATPYTLKKLELNLKRMFSDLKIAGFYSPPFRRLSEEEDREVIEMINRACPDVLWVGLGCPKQQIWMYEHRDKLKVPVMVGVGAAFDFLAGTKKQAPLWMRERGLEWLFRLLSEPKRLWKRYLIGNTIFLGLLIKEFLKIKIFNNYASDKE